MPKSQERKLLIQRVKKLGEVEEKGRERTYYEYYKSAEELDLGIRNGTIKVGKFMVSSNFQQTIYLLALEKFRLPSRITVKLMLRTRTSVFSFMVAPI